jgi:hypothetical protein
MGTGPHKGLSLVELDSVVKATPSKTVSVRKAFAGPKDLKAAGRPLTQTVNPEGFKPEGTRTGGSVREARPVLATR